MPQASVAYGLAAYPQGGDGQALVTEIQKIMADAVKNGVPADLVDASKRHELARKNFKKIRFPGWRWNGPMRWRWKAGNRQKTISAPSKK